MAEGQKSGYDGHPLAPINGYARSDAEAATTNTEELRRQKRKKYLIYFAAFVVFQTLIIVLFSLTVMKVKTPKFRVRSSSSSINTFDVPQTNTSFTLYPQFGVKNTNFGPYKYDGTTVYFQYNGNQVGSAVIPKSKANFLSTKKINVPVYLNLSGNTSNSEIMTLTSTARLSGKVELMLIFKKKKAVNMDCTMDINTRTKELQNITCK